MTKQVHDALILTVITLISGVALGTVHEITKKPIAEAQEKATMESYRNVFSDADSFREVDGFDADKASDLVHEAGYTDDDIIGAQEALDSSGNQLGYVLQVTTHAGYGGDITFSMGVTLDGVMNGYSITSISETAGLGMKANADDPKKDTDFADQFKNLPEGTYTVVKGGASGDNEIDAISGATITSKAMTGAVNAGFVYFDSLNGGGKNE